MRGQFFLLGSVVMIMAIAGILIMVSTSKLSVYEPITNDLPFRLSNLESGAENILTYSVETGASLESIKSSFSAYTAYTKNELAKERISANWDYTISGSSSNPVLDYKLILKTESSVIQDTVHITA